MVGLWAFFYAVVHVSIYLGLDQLCYSIETCEFRSIVNDVLKRKFIMMGMLSFSTMSLLALTSTQGWVRRLKKKWQTLHRLVYVSGIAGVIHFVWIQKSDYAEPLMWAGWLALFLAIRVYFSLAKRRARTVDRVARTGAGRWCSAANTQRTEPSATPSLTCRRVSGCRSYADREYNAVSRPACSWGRRTR
jgi:DMSO/TMAO reductase YedYZ heme-binding membrane subunit